MNRRNNTWLGILALILGFGILGLQMGLELRWGTVGLTVGLGALVLLSLLALRQRREGDAEVAALGPGPPEINALLDFRCLPGDWPEKAPEVLGPMASQAPSMSVAVRVADGSLEVEKRKTPLTSKHPFTARVPLRAVTDVRVTPARLSLTGSCLIFDLESGDEVRVEVPGAKPSAEELQKAFLEAVRNAEWQRNSGSGRLEITSPAPPVRTAPVRAYLLLMSCSLPFAIAMLNAIQGPFAAVSSAITFFSALTLVVVRPRWMSRALAWPMAVTALAFALDAWRVQQPSRLVGAACSAGLALWMHRASRR